MTTPKSGNLILAGLVITIGIAVCGCSVLSPQEDLSRYFVLTPVVSSDNAAPAGVASESHTITVGLGPISVPRYLDRPEVVTRLTDTEFSVSDTDRWGEPLDTGVSRVLTQDLSSELPRLEVVPFPWSKKTQIDYRVSVEFLRLERTADGKAEVQAIWTIRKGLDKQFVQRGTTTTTRAAGTDQRSASAALSEGVAQVSRDIAQALKRQSELRAGAPEQARS